MISSLGEISQRRSAGRGGWMVVTTVCRADCGQGARMVSGQRKLRPRRRQGSSGKSFFWVICSQKVQDKENFPASQVSDCTSRPQGSLSGPKRALWGSGGMSVPVAGYRAGLAFGVTPGKQSCLRSGFCGVGRGDISTVRSHPAWVWREKPMESNRAGFSFPLCKLGIMSHHVAELLRTAYDRANNRFPVMQGSR